jgi:hypothetical protein
MGGAKHFFRLINQSDDSIVLLINISGFGRWYFASTTARRQWIWTSSGVGAMDVSRSEAQRAETNVIARSVDRATTEESEL